MVVTHYTTLLLYTVMEEATVFSIFTDIEAEMEKGFLDFKIMSVISY